MFIPPIPKAPKNPKNPKKPQKNPLRRVPTLRYRVVCSILAIKHLKKLIKAHS